MQFAYIFNQQKTSDSRFLLVVPTIVGAYGVSQNFAASQRQSVAK